MKSYFIILIGLFLASCADRNCDVQTGVPFTVEEGQFYCLPNGETLDILEISNSYCPCNAQCIWQGEATVSAHLNRPNGSTNEILIHEDLKDENIHQIHVSSVSTTRACSPEIISIQLITTL